MKNQSMDYRWICLWVSVLAVNIFGQAIVFYLFGYVLSPVRLTGIIALPLLTTSLAAAPFIRFLNLGWQTRYDEFRNRLSVGALAAYLQQFWERRALNAGLVLPLPAHPSATQQAQAGEVFDHIYDDHYARNAFHTPIFLLLVTIFAEGTLIFLSSRGTIHLTTDDATARVALASMAGAYMFVVGDTVGAVRRRSLNVADVYWYALRMVLAVPLGLSLSALAETKLAAAAAFGLGTFPVDALTRLMRRLTLRQLNQAETADSQSGDQLLKLVGVTVPIASTLAAEGVGSSEQLIGMDPVLLAIRTGLPFKLILRLGAQAVVRRHVGERADQLAACALLDAQRVAALIDNLDAERQANPGTPGPVAKLLSDAASRLRETG